MAVRAAHADEELLDRNRHERVEQGRKEAVVQS